MISRIVGAALLLCGLGFAQAQGQVQGNDASDRARERLEREVRHEIVMQPNLDVFSNITFQVNGYDVKLMGQVTHPLLKTNVEAAVKRIEGVQKVDNQIEVLPVSPNDDRLRLALYRAIYGDPVLQRYAMPVIRSIRIVVKNSRATLEGVAATEADKIIIGMRAYGVSGVTSVTNNLRVSEAQR